MLGTSRITYLFDYELRNSTAQHTSVEDLQFRAHQNELKGWKLNRNNNVFGSISFVHHAGLSTVILHQHNPYSIDYSGSPSTFSSSFSIAAVTYGFSYEEFLISYRDSGEERNPPLLVHSSNAQLWSTDQIVLKNHQKKKDYWRQSSPSCCCKIVFIISSGIVVWWKLKHQWNTHQRRRWSNDNRCCEDGRRRRGVWWLIMYCVCGHR